jgi:hypothetical protein
VNGQGDYAELYNLYNTINIHTATVSRVLAPLVTLWFTELTTSSIVRDSDLFKVVRGFTRLDPTQNTTSIDPPTVLFESPMASTDRVSSIILRRVSHKGRWVFIGRDGVARTELSYSQNFSSVLRFGRS